MMFYQNDDSAAARPCRVGDGEEQHRARQDRLPVNLDLI